MKTFTLQATGAVSVHHSHHLMMLARCSMDEAQVRENVKLLLGSLTAEKGNALLKEFAAETGDAELLAALKTCEVSA